MADGEGEQSGQGPSSTSDYGREGFDQKIGSDPGGFRSDNREAVQRDREGDGIKAVILLPGSTNYGRFIISSGEIPASSDAAKLFPVFSSGSKCTLIQFAQYHGGDAGEFAQLFLVPPTVVINGTTGNTDHAGTIAITSFYMIGAQAANQPLTFGADNGGRGISVNNPFVVPPNYQVAVQQQTANTAAWSVTVGGFEIDA